MPQRLKAFRIQRLRRIVRQDAQHSIHRHRIAIRPLRRERIENVSDRKHARFHRELARAQIPVIAAPIELFVVRAGDKRQVLKTRDAFQDALRVIRMQPHRFPFLRIQLVSFIQD